jgi:hypothetical protein
LRQSKQWEPASRHHFFRFPLLGKISLWQSFWGRLRSANGRVERGGAASNSFCIDPTHIAPLNQFFKDAANGTLASFSYIDPGFGHNDEHPGSGQSIFAGQAQVANILNQFMNSKAWADSVFFLSYDEGGGPYDHVPAVPGHSNDNIITADMGFLPNGDVPDISAIAVNPDSHKPCLANGPPDSNGNPTPTANCDLQSSDPGQSQRTHRRFKGSRHSWVSGCPTS